MKEERRKRRDNENPKSAGGVCGHIASRVDTDSDFELGTSFGFRVSDFGFLNT
jgi:hypothetical protein